MVREASARPSGRSLAAASEQRVGGGWGASEPTFSQNRCGSRLPPQMGKPWCSGAAPPHASAVN